MQNPFEIIDERLSNIEILLNAIKNSPEKETPSTKNRNLKQAAEYCGNMPIPTFRKHLNAGHIAGSKPGKSWIFSQKDLDDFLEKFRRKTRQEIEAEAEDYIYKRK
ncbi:MAG: helix-turn-helix domain-containing protein [Bacteroidales bacterium]|nr:helix-turn-helix domain-containing protein [Bacteroidales bacterium]